MVSCQSCGSKHSKDGQHCDHCGGKLSKLLCRKCFYPLPASASFCMLCGTEQVHGHGEEVTTDLECPNCALTFGFEHDERVVHLSVKPASVEVQGTEVALHYYECPKCHGNWVSEQVLISMLEQSASRKSKIEPEERSRSLDARAYLKCPSKDCGEMLSRFLWTRIIKKPPAGASFPAVDKCSSCSGVWLDNGELDWLLEKGAKALPAEEHSKKSQKETRVKPPPSQG